MSKTTPHPVDVHVGARLRQRRAQIGLSQSAIAEAAGITFQQVQKYEKGTNRCSSSMLWKFAQALSVEPSFFFEELKVGKAKAGIVAADAEQLNRRETLGLMRDYYGLPKTSRTAFRDLLRSLATA